MVQELPLEPLSLPGGGGVAADRSPMVAHLAGPSESNTGGHGYCGVPSSWVAQP